MSKIKEAWLKLLPSRTALLLVFSAIAGFWIQCWGTFIMLHQAVVWTMWSDEEIRNLSQGVIDGFGLPFTICWTIIPFVLPISQLWWKRGARWWIELFLAIFGIIFLSVVIISTFSYFWIPLIFLFIPGILRIFVRDYLNDVEKIKKERKTKHIA